MLGSIAAALPTAFVVRSMFVNGEHPGPTLTVGTLVCLALLGTLTLQVLTVVSRMLGRRRWHWSPAAPWFRGAAAAVAGPPIGVVGHLRIAVFVAGLGAGAAWWGVARPGRPNAGTWPYWIAVCLAGGLAPWTSLVGAGLAALAFWRAGVGLEQRRGRP